MKNRTQMESWYQYYEIKNYNNTGIPAGFELMLKHANIDLKEYGEEFQFIFNAGKLNSFCTVKALINSIFKDVKIIVMNFVETQAEQKISTLKKILGENKIPLISIAHVINEKIKGYECLPVLNIQQDFILCGLEVTSVAQDNFKAKKIIAIPIPEIIETHKKYIGGRDIVYVE